MYKIIATWFFTLIVSLLMPSFATAQVFSSPTNIVEKNITQNQILYKNIAANIWDWSELGYHETQSSQLLVNTLLESGFSVDTGVAGMPTAFVASYGSGEPVIALLAEYDALPGFSQTADPVKKASPHQQNGHACGHHLLGTASVAAAIAVKYWLAEKKVKGTVKLYGTPAEEGGSGKSFMVRDGLFDDVDAAFHWHPYNSTSALPESTLARISLKFNFEGIAAHASNAPQNGRSALDGVESMNFMINMMREHIRSDARIHYVVTQGGDSPNIVPAKAQTYYYIRAPSIDILNDLVNRVQQAAQGAALGTGTVVNWHIVSGTYNILPNVGLQKILDKNIKRLNDVEYTKSELRFAGDIAVTLPDTSRQRVIEKTMSIPDFTEEVKLKMASTDVGDVSWVVPMGGLWVATFPSGTSLHSWQAVASGKSSFAYKGMVLAAKTLAQSSIDLIENPEQIKSIRKEWEVRRGEDFDYKPLMGDVPVDLDYWFKSRL